MKLIIGLFLCLDKLLQLCHNSFMLCPFLSKLEYAEINEIGWEYDEGTKGLHYFIEMENGAGVFFDVFQESDKTFTLYCGEFDCENQKNNCDFQPQKIKIDQLLHIVSPYLKLSLSNFKNNC